MIFFFLKKKKCIFFILKLVEKKVKNKFHILPKQNQVKQDMK